MKNLILNNDYKVTLHNDLVTATFLDTLTITEQKLIYCILSNIEPPEFEIGENGKRKIKNRINSIEPFLVTLKDLASFIGVKEIKYQAFKDLCKGLMKKIIGIEKSDGSFKYIQWVYESEYIAGLGMLKIEISPKLYPYVLNLENHFTSVSFSALMQFKSKYSARLYCLLKKWQKVGEFTIQVDALKSILGVPVVSEKNGIKVFKLQSYGHFKDRALEKAVEEINKYTELKVDYEESKIGRKVAAITFNISSKTVQKDVVKPLENKVTNLPSKTAKTYGDDFISHFDIKERKAYDKETQKVTYFNGRERIKLILLNRNALKYGNEFCEELEEELLKIEGIPSFKNRISEELYYLFNYVEQSKGINYPNKFIVKKTKELINLIEDGQEKASFRDFLKDPSVKIENVPNWYFEGEKPLSDKQKTNENNNNYLTYNGEKISHFTMTDLKRVQVSIKLDSPISEEEKNEYKRIVKLYNLKEIESENHFK